MRKPSLKTGQLLMSSKANNSGGKKKRVRKKRKQSAEQKVPEKTPLSEANDVPFDRSLEDKFDSDWSDFPGAVNEEKKVELPSNPYAATAATESTSSEYKSVLPPIGQTKKAAQKPNYEEPTALRYLKIGTWFGIIALVALEIYVQSPFFQRPEM
eukprot:CAMPEP_0117756722 /NCGR_PEP_ID=MMETSP0947-20121206/14264_1 /TAXON_ID=44440 /ORGANISM="Chattonella subsalsa, Strain CCMP2191" /LENGTH=154 /DNA_ID=CAMNT_0005576397 /DNA_START=198 /DNA_END=661 /DNA_ORIENTATION=-